MHYFSAFNKIYKLLILIKCIIFCIVKYHLSIKTGMSRFNENILKIILKIYKELYVKNIPFNSFRLSNEYIYY